MHIHNQTDSRSNVSWKRWESHNSFAYTLMFRPLISFCVFRINRIRRNRLIFTSPTLCVVTSEAANSMWPVARSELIYSPNSFRRKIIAKRFHIIYFLNLNFSQLSENVIYWFLAIFFPICSDKKINVISVKQRERDQINCRTNERWRPHIHFNIKRIRCYCEKHHTQDENGCYHTRVVPIETPLLMREIMFNAIWWRREIRMCSS